MNGELTEVSCPDLTLLSDKELFNAITAFAALNQPVMDTTLKEMFVSLRHTMHSDITTLVQQFNLEVQDVGESVKHFESKMGEIYHHI